MPLCFGAARVSKRCFSRSCDSFTLARRRHTRTPETRSIASDLAAWHAACSYRGMRPSAATTSAALHAAALLGLLFLYRADLVPLRPMPDPSHYVVVPYAPPRLVRSAGGGQRETRPASKGRLPPRATRRFFLPPM